jgi:Na+/H+-dicarboxylate symporter
MRSRGAPIGLMGVILPIYTIIDMIETAENVWSDSSVCAMTDHDLAGKLEEPEGSIAH